MKSLITIPQETIIRQIYFIRDMKVMFDKDLAELYDVETKAWQSGSLRSQFVTLKRGKHIKYTPTVFTEQGVAMLSSVLRSKKAIQVNIQIIRTFTKLREILSENKKLAEKLEKMELKYDKKIADIFRVIRSLILEKKKPVPEVKPVEPKEKMGFVIGPRD